MAVKKSELYSILWEACNKLRGGVEPARYKDYVLVLLFFKYVSDRYKGQRRADFVVNPGASFDDLINAKGKPDVGERVNKILQKFLEDNELVGELPDVSFINADELGSGKELVDKVSGLIAVFENPAIDFRTNRASGDDIIGDAYEYFMMKFAQESGKSKGQFYTPSEVSRTIARLIGIGDITAEDGKDWTLYDPACGSGSLLIRAADEAPVDEHGDSIVTIFGQEKDISTAGLAKMNLILHQKGTGTIEKGNTLSDPKFITTYQSGLRELKQFDFIVMNPPFSDKAWSDGIKPEKDEFHRFDGFGIPPEKNGDYAWFLHVIKSLRPNGKAGIIMPHGILFRGNAEEDIRKKVLETRYIKGIVSLPGNLFYGTGIPACIVIIDKECAETRDNIFFIDASKGFKKDGNKNRLREQDIEKIVRVFNGQEILPGYSRSVPYSEILNEKNGGNMNVPRYIKKIDDTLPQNISAHLHGGIPKYDIESLERLWNVSPALRDAIFNCTDAEHGIYQLAVSSDKIESIFNADENLLREKQLEGTTVFEDWQNCVQDILLSITEATEPKQLIHELGAMILQAYLDSVLLDNYDIYDCLLNYWNEKLQDDVYAIRAYGYEAAREIEFVYATKKKKDENGDTVIVADKTKIKSFDGSLIPREIMECTYFSEWFSELQTLNDHLSSIEAEMESMREEESGDDGLLKEVLTSKGDLPKVNLTKRIKELEAKKTSPELMVLAQMVDILDNQSELERISKEIPLLEKTYDLRTKKGIFQKSKVKAAWKAAILSAPVPDIYLDEYNCLLSYQEKMNACDEINKQIKAKQKELDNALIVKYSELTIEEIKHLLFDEKWMTRLYSDVNSEIERILNDYMSQVIMIAKRYEHTLGELEKKVAQSRDAVHQALERMGYKNDDVSK